MTWPHLVSSIGAEKLRDETKKGLIMMTNKWLIKFFFFFKLLTLNANSSFIIFFFYQKKGIKIYFFVEKL